MPKNVTYYPPKPKVIEKYARDVCKALDIKSATEINDFTDLIKTLVRIKVKQLNSDDSINEEENHDPQEK